MLFMLLQCSFYVVNLGIHAWQGKASSQSVQAMHVTTKHEHSAQNQHEKQLHLTVAPQLSVQLRPHPDLRRASQVHVL